MSGISRYTALLLKYGEITIQSTESDGLFGYWIVLRKDGVPHIAPLVSAAPCFETRKLAIRAARDLVKNIKSMADI